MSQKQAPLWCIHLAGSTSCQAVYVGTSSLALILLVVLFVKEMNQEGHGPLVRWETYIVQDWGEGTCSNGTRLDDIGTCRTAFNAYKEKCESRDEKVQEESWDGQPGCHMQDAAFAEFQFNKNLKEVRTADHAPVCKIDEAQPLKCYKDKPAFRKREPLLEAFVFLLMVIPAFVMCFSRLCVPACCPAGTKNLPGCCPFNCFAQLDTTYYVAGGIQLPLSIREFMGVPDEDAWVLWIFCNMVYPFIVIATVITAIVRLCVMADCCCEECKPASHAPVAQLVGAPHAVVAFGPTVVGQPVVGQPVDGYQYGQYGKGS